ncbi:Hypothetical_protein [Hexamita inflata]|uniref:Hypothetical_protein n=1 Tax=Hexamita inflata TaxID=28002 RepID=A0AA86PAM9_9EUKA|nr:Hypothetical protein HINF_LOCUS21836 [Hexamita inflata]CAI9972132.1 Hypothetical protein HINF_LOCUS59777 [Hexamita inflata]
MPFSLVSAALLCNTELVSLLRCFCWGDARWRPGCRFGCAFLVGGWRRACSGLAAWRERLRCGAAWSSGSQCGEFRCLGLSWAGAALVLLAGLLAVRLLSSLSAAWFLFQCSRILTILLSLGKMEADSRIKGAVLDFWQGNESLSSLEALSEENDRKARESWISAGSSLDKSYFVREFLCLKYSEASSELTLLTDSSFILLLRSLSSALPALCLEFYQVILTFSLSLPEIKTDPRFQVSVLNSGRKSEL